MNITWCDDLVRLSPINGEVLDGDDQTSRNDSIRLTSPRRAFASFQLCVGPLGGNDTVTVQPGMLKGQGKAKLSADAFDVYIAWYQQHGEAWYPEVLVPQHIPGGSTPEFRKHNAARGQRFAGFWVDLHIPAGAASGAYSGAVTVHAGKETLSINLDLMIMKAVLPESSCLDVSLNNYADSISPAWPSLRKLADPFSTKLYQRVERGVFRTAQEHNMFLHYIPYQHSGYMSPGFAPPLKGEGPHKHVAEWKQWDQRFGPLFDGTAFAGSRRGPIPVRRFYLPLNLCWPADFLKFNQPGYEAEWRAVGKDMVEHFRSRGWTRTRFDMFLNHKQRFRYFPWDTEEARFMEDNDIHRYFRKLWEGTFDRASTSPVKFDYTLGTTWTYGWDIKSDLTEFIDVFIAGTNWIGWYRDKTPQLHNKGRQIWACSHSGSVPTSLRAPAFVPLFMWMQNIDGFMPSWCSLGNWAHDSWRTPAERGGATFLYPGYELGSEETFASLRLKTLRNALQTVDLLQSASTTRRGGKQAVRKSVNRLLGISDQDGWSAKRPAFVDKKLPKDWTKADFATKEPPLAGWEKFPTSVYRRLSNTAITLASGGQQ